MTSSGFAHMSPSGPHGDSSGSATTSSSGPREDSRGSAQEFPRGRARVRPRTRTGIPPGTRRNELIEVRQTQESDVADIARIERDSYGQDSWSVNQVRDEIAGIGGTRWYATAVVDGAVAGYVGLFLAPPDVDIQTLTVARECSRRGIGRLLLTGALAAVKEKSCHRVFLEVRADNVAALGLYRSFGFERLGIRRAYYADGVDAVNMRLRLSETTLQEVLR